MNKLLEIVSYIIFPTSVTTLVQTILHPIQIKPSEQPQNKDDTAKFLDLLVNHTLDGAIQADISTKKIYSLLNHYLL